MTTIIDSLKEFLTPRILESVKNYAGTEADKTSLIEALYPLVAGQLTQKSVFERLASLDFGKFGFNFGGSDEAEIYSAQNLKLDHEEHEVLMSKLLGENTEPSAIKAVYDKLSEKFTLPVATVAALVAATLPFAFTYLKSRAGDKPVYEYLESEKEGFLSGVPTWLVGVLPAGVLGAAAPNTDVVPTNPISTAGEVTNATTNGATTATTTNTTTTQKQEEGGFLKSLLPIIGLIILGGLAWLMLKSCQKQPTPVAAPVAEVVKADSVALAPASVDVKLNAAGDALATCTAKVGTLTFGEKIRAGIAKTFGAESCELVESKDTAVEMPAEQYLPQVLGFMKGVPDASLNATDKTITLGSSDPAALEKLVADVKTALPSDFEVTAAGGDTASTAVALTPATLALALNDKGDTINKCDSKVGTGLGDKVRSLISGVFGADNCNFAEDAGTDANLAVEPHLPKILELMKGVPNATLDVSGNKLSFGSSDPVALEKLLADVKGVVGADFEVGSATGTGADTGAGADTSTTTTLAPATLSLALNDKGDAIANCESKVGTGLGNKVRSLIAGVFGAEKCAFNEDAGTDTNLAAEPHLAKVLELMKGVPNATLSVDGNKLSFGSSDPKALEKLLADVKGVVGADFEVAGVASEAETVAKAIEESSKAIDSLSKDASPEELVKALNLQIINFATGSNEIPAANKAVLDKAATLMKDLPNAQLVITGHTDNRGAADMNKKLSEKRAKSVHDYLVSKGVDDAKLEVKGVGPDEPVASNDTPEGRFKNRRIEFKLMNNGETVADTSK